MQIKEYKENEWKIRKIYETIMKYMSIQQMTMIYDKLIKQKTSNQSQ